MEEKEILLSAEGLKKIVAELDHLRNVKRKEVAERLKEARSHGDLSENSEYDDARNEQGFVEGRIAQLEKMVRLGRVMETPNGSTEEVRLGSVIRLRDLEDNLEQEYTIVSSVEASPAEYKISNESPVGRAVMGQKAGAEVVVEAPMGFLRYQVISILR